MKKILLFTLFLLNPLLSEDTIQVHTCYGNAHELIVEGRLLDENLFIERSQSDSKSTNLWNKLGQMLNSEIKNTPMTLVLDDKPYFTISDDEGYFLFNIHEKNNSFVNKQSLQLFLNERNLSRSCLALVLDEKEQVGIISDFDDTVIISDVIHKLDLINNTFFKNYKQREVVLGMAERFKKILAENEANETSALFFITGSPKQLERSIDRFLDFHHFPERTIITKKAHGDKADSFFDQISYKESKIEKLITFYPHVKWVCFGDSGEQDKEVYERIRKKYPQHIKSIFIRNVESGEILKIY
ncbi:MAG: Unknown protein [uncultured Sulfurovum sp.]|uniref:Phosphatidate phosphatase APP1 catalytic domain-containing protein n=1 Tax=uncultured Sulfurovum sp. TaxID=269237 RepID=A0A6S6RYS7_9BACT|nr:MAG: Unknown protein [uncultured Sulfurovum sp.]